MRYCEHHAWTEITAIGDEQRRFLCGVCGERKTEERAISSYAAGFEQVWREVVKESIDEMKVKRLLNPLDLDKLL